MFNSSFCEIESKFILAIKTALIDKHVPALNVAEFPHDV